MSNGNSNDDEFDLLHQESLVLLNMVKDPKYVSWDIEQKEEAKVRMLDLVPHGVGFRSSGSDSRGTQSPCKSLVLFEPQPPIITNNNIPGFVICDNSSGKRRSTYRFLPVTHVNPNESKAQHLSRLPNLDPLPFFREFHTLIGSHKGWLVDCSYSRSDGTCLFLINPASGAEIPLPPLKFSLYKDLSSLKAYLDILPWKTSPSYVVLLSPKKKIKEVLFYKMGDKHWSFAEPEPIAHRRYYHDVIFHEGRFFLVDNEGNVYYFVTYFPQIREYSASYVRKANHFGSMNFNYFLVGLKEKLLVVSVTDFEVSSFEVHEAIFTKYTKNPVRVPCFDDLNNENLGGHALFLGRNQATVLKTSEVAGIKENTIFYLKQNPTSNNYVIDRDGIITHCQLDDKITGLLDGVWFTPLPWDPKDTIETEAYDYDEMTKRAGCDVYFQRHVVRLRTIPNYYWVELQKREKKRLSRGCFGN